MNAKLGALLSVCAAHSTPALPAFGSHTEGFSTELLQAPLHRQGVAWLTTRRRVLLMAGTWCPCQNCREAARHTNLLPQAIDSCFRFLDLGSVRLHIHACCSLAHAVLDG